MMPSPPWERAEVVERSGGIEDGARLVVNLGMTGRLVLSDAPRAGELRHVAVRFELHDGRALLYDDVRRFGLCSALCGVEQTRGDQPREDGDEDDDDDEFEEVVRLGREFRDQANAEPQ